jgi:hypothetical protein
VLFGGCLPAIVEFGRHYPSVGHAPKFREMVFSVSQNEHGFGVFLPYWCTWAREELAAQPQTTLSGERGSGVSPL